MKSKNILIIGCGKVGSRLACVLSNDGYDVSVIDDQEQNFDLLDNDFKGSTLLGVSIDRDTLKRAGIENCDAVAALSQDDNINIMVSQVAKEIFHVPQVLARIYDTKRESVFSHFGLQTVCPANLTVESIYSMLTTQDSDIRYNTFGSATVAFNTICATKEYIGKNVSDIKIAENQTIFGLIHKNGNMSLVKNGSRLIICDEDKIVLSKVID